MGGERGLSLAQNSLSTPLYPNPAQLMTVIASIARAT